MVNHATKNKSAKINDTKFVGYVTCIINNTDESKLGIICLVRKYSQDTSFRDSVLENIATWSPFFMQLKVHLLRTSRYSSCYTVYVVSHSQRLFEGRLSI